MACFKRILVALFYAAVANGWAIKYATIVEPRQLQESYDFVVVGGGTAGATVAARLSEDPEVSVLLIEAGPLDKGEEFVTIPKNVGGAMNTIYDWNYTTLAQPILNNRAIRLPIGHVIGGSSVLNGMLFDRGAASDYDAWEEMGNPGWGWKDLLPYFKKSETFHPPEASHAEKFGITWDWDAHGTDGPIHSSYPPYFPDTHTIWFQSLNQLGIPTEKDGASGRAVNAFWAPQSLDPATMTRSYARTGYFNPASKRPNFHAIVEQQVTKLVAKNLKAKPVKYVGVEFAPKAGAARTTVGVKKEVILSAGVVGSVRVLELSGIGPADLLKKLKISVAVDLPGVGNNFQDHGYGGIQNFFQKAPVVNIPNPEELYRKNKTGPWTNSSPNALAFISLNQTTTPEHTARILGPLTRDDPTYYLRVGAPKEVVAGYKKQLAVLAKHLATEDMGANEYMWGGGSVSLSQAHPFSRGYIEINSSDPFVYPTIDFRYFSHPLDWNITVVGFRFARKIIQAPAAAALEPREGTPGPSTQTDLDWLAFIRQRWSTMFHPSCSNPMQPRELGGVVDPELKVYGTSNVRVIDASIFPLIPGTHLQATTYAVAEKGADIIKAAYAKK